MDTDHSFIMRNFKIFSSSLLEITLFLCTAAILYMVSKSSLDLQAFPVSLEEANAHRSKDTRLEEGETVRGREATGRLPRGRCCRVVQEAMVLS